MKNLTAVSDFTMKMCGTQNDRACKTKGAETYGIMLFLLYLMDKYSHRLGSEGQRLRRAGQNLSAMVDLWRNCGAQHGMLVPDDVKQRCFDLYSEHMVLMECEDIYTPKHHIIVHLLDRLGFQGNPQQDVEGSLSTD